MTSNNTECLLCHAVHAESNVKGSNRSWRCHRCGQHWDDARIATVVGYQQWANAQVATVAPVATA